MDAIAFGSMLTESIYGAPIATWLAFAAVLGGITVWIYWRLHASENSALARAGLAAAAQPAPAAAEVAAREEGGGAADERSAERTLLEGGLLEGVEAARLEAALRRVLTAAKSGSTLDLARLEAALDGAASPAEIEAQRYRNWLLSNRLRQLEAQAAPRPAPPSEASSPPPAAPYDGPADAAEAARDDALERAIAAAKLGRMNELAAIEASVAAGVDPLEVRGAALFGVDLAGDGAPGSLRYRNWLLAGALRRALTAAQMGDPIDVEAVETALRRASRAAASTEAEPEAAAAPATPPEDAEAEADRLRALGDELSQLRYRAWFLGRRLAEMMGAARRGEVVDATLAEAVLAAGGVEIDFAEEDGAGLIRAAPGADAAEDDIARLRVRVSELEAALDAAAATAPAIDADAADARLAAALSDAGALRGRLAGAERALRDLRAAPDGAADVLARLQAAEAAAEEMREKAWALEQRVGESERRERAAIAQAADAEAQLAEAAAEADALRGQLAPAEAAIDEVQTAKAAAAALRSRLWIAERRAGARDAMTVRIRQLETALATAEEERAQAEQAPSADPQLLTELETLRSRLRAYESAGSEPSEAQQRQQAEIEALRSRLSQAQTELEELTAQIRRGRRKIAGQVSVLGKVQSARAKRAGGGATPLPGVPTPAAASVAGAVAVAKESAPAPARVAEKRPTASERAKEIDERLASARRSPQSGAEAAAAELIERGEVVAISSNRPHGLLTRPSSGPPDDLKLIEGVSTKLETIMNGFGLYYFQQLAGFGPEDLAWIDDRLALRGQTVRMRWVPQARALYDLKESRALDIGADGTWTRADAPRPSGGDAARRAPAGEGRRPRPTLAALAAPRSVHPAAVNVDAPLFGAEVTALELLEDRAFVAEGPAPAGFRRLAEGEAPDDLTLIVGIGPELEATLRAEGAGLFETLARLDPKEIAWLDRTLGLNGRVIRDRWIPQARHWADRKTAGALRIGPEGAWTAGPPAAEAENLLESAGAGPEEADGGPADGAANAPAATRLVEPTAMRARSVSALTPRPAPETKAEARLSEVEADAQRLLEEKLVALEPAPPIALDASAAGAPDDLKLIRGVDPALEKAMNALGVHYFGQLSALTAPELAWLDLRLGLGGRIVRDRWRPQCQALAERKANGDMHLGPEGAWSLAESEDEAGEVAAIARASPFLRAEIDATRLINAHFEANEADRPEVLLAAPEGGTADDLQMIVGIGPRLEALLNDLGVYHFRQIAAFGPRDIAWIDAKMRFKGRIIRDRWLVQAAELERRRRTD